MAPVNDSSPLLHRGTSVRHAKGRSIFREGDPSGAVYEVVAGRIRVEVSTPTGGRLVLGVKGPGDLLGELGALDGRARSATAVALEDCELIQTGIDDFLAVLEEKPAAAVSLLQRISRDLRLAVDRTTARASADTTQRLAMLLADLAERFGEHNAAADVTIDLALTQDDLAGWIGATREATARSLRTLRDRSAVTTARRQITVTDLDVLVDIAFSG